MDNPFAPNGGIDINIGVDLFGNVAVSASELFVTETPLKIIEEQNSGFWREQSRAFDNDDPLQISGPSIRITTITDLG